MAGTSLVTLAKRALITLLITFARQYQIPALVVNRDSPDKVVPKGFRKVACKVRRRRRRREKDPLDEGGEAWGDTLETDTAAAQ